VSTTASSLETCAVVGMWFRFSLFADPWNIPQSTRTLAELVSRR
jgi:hypothetical protein